MRAEDDILITGATGFVGSALAATLLMSTPHRLVSLVRNDPGGARVCSAVAAALAGLGGDPEAAARVLPLPVDDFGDRASLERTLRDIRAREVWHVAAHMAYDESGLVAAVDFNSVVSSTLLQTVGGLERFHYISTTSVAGPGDVGAPRSVPEDLLTAMQPLNPYNISKCLAEHMLWHAAERRGIGLTVLRLPAVIGAARNGWANGSRIGYYSYLAVLNRLLARTDRFHFEIDPEGRIPLLHIDQLGAIAVRLRERPAPPAREVFNLCTADPMSIAAQFGVFEALTDHRLRVGFGEGSTAAERTFNRLNAHNNRYMSTRNSFTTTELAAAVGTENLPTADADSLGRVIRFALEH